MKKTFPIILSSILAITVTSSVAHATTADNYLLFNPTTQNNQPGFSLVGMTSTSTTAATTAKKTTTQAKKAVQTTEHKLTWTGTYGKQPLSIKSVQETLKKYEQLPTQKPWNFAGKMVSDAKPIILECVNQYGKNLTLGAFAHCCGTGRTTPAPVQETYGQLTHDPKACQELIEIAIKIHNDNVKTLATCMPENDKLATAGHYIWVNGVKKCASTQCKDGYSTAKYENGNSKGFCIKVGSSCQLNNAVTATIDNNGKCVATECNDGFGVTPTGSCEIKTEALKIPQTGLAVAEISPKIPEIATPIETPDATQLVMTEQEAQQQVAQITGNDKNDKKVQKLTSEIECLEMGVNSANVAEMNKCKKDPEAYAIEQRNEELCKNSGYNKGTAEFRECKKDPAAFAQSMVQETRCKALGATGALADLCKQDPDAYTSKKSECEGMGATGNKLTQCIRNVDGYKSQLASQQEKLAIENRCIGMGASGQNKNLCMEDPDAYASNKSECESMGAKNNDLNRCIRNIENYRSDYQIAQRAKELGVSERNAKKIMENEEQIKKLQESLGQV